MTIWRVRTWQRVLKLYAELNPETLRDGCDRGSFPRVPLRPHNRQLYEFPYSVYKARRPMRTRRRMNLVPLVGVGTPSLHHVGIQWLGLTTGWADLVRVLW